MDGSTLAEQPLVALEPVAEAGFFKRIWDMIVLFCTIVFIIIDAYCQKIRSS